MGNTKWVLICLCLILMGCSSENKKEEFKSEAVKGVTITETNYIKWGQPYGYLSSDSPISCTSFIDTKLVKNNQIVLTVTQEASAKCTGEKGIGEAGISNSQLNNLSPGVHSLYSRLRWTLVSTSPITDNFTNKVITGPIYGYYENSLGQLLPRDEEGYSFIRTFVILYETYLPIIFGK